MYRLKYGCRIAGKILPAGYVVKIADLKDVHATFPNMDINDNSQFVGIKLDFLSCITIIHRSEII